MCRIHNCVHRVQGNIIVQQQKWKGIYLLDKLVYGPHINTACPNWTNTYFPSLSLSCVLAQSSWCNQAVSSQAVSVCLSKIKGHLALLYITAASCVMEKFPSLPCASCSPLTTGGILSLPGAGRPFPRNHSRTMGLYWESNKREIAYLLSSSWQHEGGWISYVRYVFWHFKPGW